MASFIKEDEHASIKIGGIEKLIVGAIKSIPSGGGEELEDKIPGDVLKRLFPNVDNDFDFIKELKKL